MNSGYGEPSNQTPGSPDYASAPQIVKSARFLIFFNVFLWGLGALGILGIGLHSAHPIRAMALGGFFILLAGFYIWLAAAIKRGMSAGYYILMVLAILSLFGFPLGTLLYGYLLFFWVKPETKAYFGIF